MLDPLLNWRLKTPFYYGWLILGITSLATFCATGVSQVVLGGIQVYHKRRYRLERRYPVLRGYRRDLGVRVDCALHRTAGRP